MLLNAPVLKRLKGIIFAKNNLTVTHLVNALTIARLSTLVAADTIDHVKQAKANSESIISVELRVAHL
jgi:hypothetical protein